MNGNSASPSIVEQQLREEARRLLPLVEKAAKYYLERDELIDPSPWADQLDQQKNDKLAQRFWPAQLSREIAHLAQELFANRIYPVDLEFSKGQAEYSRRINHLLGEWRKRFPNFRYCDDFIYWIQPQFRRMAGGEMIGPGDFRVQRISLTFFVMFVAQNRSLLLELGWRQNLRLAFARWWARIRS